MSRVDRLLKNYERFVSLPWDKALAGPQRVWFVIYNKTDERRMRARLPEFELATKAAGHGWQQVDLTDCFPRWMAGQEYRESYFHAPEKMGILIDDFRDSVIQDIRTRLGHPDADCNTVMAVSGIACLFGFVKASKIVEGVRRHIRGRLVVFFPGEYENNKYRLLDTGDGWNYLAVPITAAEGL